ncbi:MAG: hypothetical protein FWD86_00040 [Firmicutes bacterium]|nr:hypothetical protein [Bacillota bacterium]
MGFAIGAGFGMLGFATNKVANVVKAKVKVVNTTVVPPKTHGNSLQSPAVNYGYKLIKQDTGQIMKIGESIHKVKRYPQKFYKLKKVYMQIEIIGSKKTVHLWQHDMIMMYKKADPLSLPWNLNNW